MLFLHETFLRTFKDSNTSRKFSWNDATETIVSYAISSLAMKLVSAWMGKSTLTMFLEYSPVGQPTNFNFDRSSGRGKVTVWIGIVGNGVLFYKVSSMRREWPGISTSDQATYYSRVGNVFSTARQQTFPFYFVGIRWGTSSPFYCCPKYLEKAVL